MPLYLYTILCSFLLALLSTPLFRMLALRLNIQDAPAAPVKTHAQTVPQLGGAAIWLGFIGTLTAIRLFTQFPTGTLYNLRGLYLGSTLIFLLGLMDDWKKPKGLHFKTKFLIQILAALLLTLYGVRIHFIQPDLVAILLTLLWVVGITNALNLIDVMDGLCPLQAAVASLGFLWITLPSENIYVNFAAAALSGACLGFLPYNLSQRRKIFLGDAGSLFLGFALASLSLGSSYSHWNPLGVYAPFLILGIPLYDTFLVMILRLTRKKSPFLASKDHFALRLMALGFSKTEILALTSAAGLLLSLCAFLITQVSTTWALWVYAVAGIELLLISWKIAKIPMG
ncbi:MAG: undecaprenyl/decaprenyl-phosphate alpha-N-acetylglucosaminyl 1-phosphate transferase [Elusimicrobia bacterium]|nr:undecaprenyl/decaprenyl-phosphate alpha-N-acetylglucosaminyl 1-phosphate transferase [Elusimicrobiota bacterium]